MDYIERHIDPEPEYLRKLYHDASLRLLYTRMMSGHLQGRLLKMFTQMINPGRVLELGTYAGYATLCIAEGLRDDAVIDTVEIDDELETFILEHLGCTPLGSKISLHIGDAMEVVPALAARTGKWDMVFLDADKRQYPQYYTMLMPYVADGGWILADNTLWSGKVIEADQGHRGNRKDEQLDAIMQFNDMVAADPNVEKVILPLRDGLTIIRKLR